MVNLAWRWKISPEYLSRVANNPKRDPWWDDAIAGIPKLMPRDARQIDKARLAANPPIKRDRNQDLGPESDGYRYHDDLEPGAIVALTSDMGDYREGTRGVVKQRESTAKGERYLIAFGEFEDWYGPADIDRMMAATGAMAGCDD